MLPVNTSVQKCNLKVRYFTPWYSASTLFYTLVRIQVDGRAQKRFIQGLSSSVIVALAVAVLISRQVHPSSYKRVDPIIKCPLLLPLSKIKSKHGEIVHSITGVLYTFLLTPWKTRESSGCSIGTIACSCPPT